MSTHTNGVTAVWLKAILKIGAPKLCILDAAYLAENYTELYDNVHIPGALHFDINSVKNDTMTHLNMPVHPVIFQDYIRSRGIDNTCHVILYNHGESAESIMSVLFAFWTFKVFGFSKVSVLRDGLIGWRNRGFATSNETVTVEKRGNFKSSWNSGAIASYNEVLENFETEKYLIVDTRPKAYFQGKEKSKYAKSKGRIKGSINIPYTEFLTEKGMLKSDAHLRRVLLNAGITGRKPVIASCETGFSASMLYFVLRNANVECKLYSGSWVEWSYLAPEDLME